MVYDIQATAENSVKLNDVLTDNHGNIRQKISEQLDLIFLPYQYKEPVSCLPVKTQYVQLLKPNNSMER